MKTENIKQLIQLFEESSVAKMELEIEDIKIKLEKPVTSIINTAPVASLASIAPEAIAPVASKEIVEEGTWIKSPIVGTFYSSRTQGSTPFVEIGKRVKKGDVLCIIEAMKVMNEIHSPMDGVILAILPTNESMVEYDQDLIRIGE